MNKIKEQADAIYKKEIAKAYATSSSATNKVLNFLLVEAQNTEELINEYSYLKNHENAIKEKQEYMTEILNEAWLHLMIAINKNYERHDIFEREFWMFFDNYNIHLVEFSCLKLQKLARAIRSAVVQNEYPVIENLTRTEHIDEIIESLQNIQYFLAYFNCKTVKDLFDEFEKTFSIFNDELKKLNYFDYEDESSWYWEHIEQVEECQNIYGLRQEIMQLISDYKKYIK